MGINHKVYCAKISKNIKPFFEMKIENETFSKLLKQFEYRYDLRTVFDDFLTMSICAVTQNPVTKLSHYEELYLKTIEPYKEEKLRFEFPKMFASLVSEMDLRVHANEGNDVLGEVYEQNFSRKGSSQFFTPWPICNFMAKSTGDYTKKEADRPLRILDPVCGSGRMLLAAKDVHGKWEEYYGIDIDSTCVKMTALNLFLNGVFKSEVMCANALFPDDFIYSYRISLFPLGIFRIEEKEKFKLWHLMKNSLNSNKDAKTKTGTSKIILGTDQEKFDASKVSQIKLF